jgi:hypothetical protein
VDAFFVDNKRRGTRPSSADALDNCYLLAITQLNELKLSTSLRACNNFYCANYAYLKASFVKVVHVVVVYAILSFSVLN